MLWFPSCWYCPAGRFRPFRRGGHHRHLSHPCRRCRGRGDGMPCFLCHDQTYFIHTYTYSHIRNMIMIWNYCFSDVAVLIHTNSFTKIIDVFFPKFFLRDRLVQCSIRNRESPVLQARFYFIHNIAKSNTMVWTSHACSKVFHVFECSKI